MTGTFALCYFGLSQNIVYHLSGVLKLTIMQCEASVYLPESNKLVGSIFCGIYFDKT